MGKLAIDRLRKEYAGGDENTVAVDGIDITIDDGEFLVLVGPSGCGKSTILRCIAGLEDVTSGRILRDDVDITHQNPKNRDIAMVFQDYALYPHLTTRQNMGFGLKMGTSLSKDRIEERVEEVAEMSGITDLLDKKPDELSGGQQQRVALGRAIVRDPEIFLMDEPLSNLDAKLRSHLRTELQNLQQKLDVTTIYVTHDQTEAMTMGDRVAILDGGKLQQIGKPLDCYNKPNNTFVATFIGSPKMNMIEVTYEDGQLRNESFSFPISAELDSICQSHQSSRYYLGIRPEDVKPAKTPEDAVIQSTVKVVEPVGDLSHGYVDVGGEEWIITFDSSHPISAGDQISFTFNEADMHLFDNETGEAIKNKSEDESISVDIPYM